MSTVPVTQRVSAGQTAGQGEGGQQEENGGVRKPGARAPCCARPQGAALYVPVSRESRCGVGGSLQAGGSWHLPFSFLRVLR